MDAVRDYFAQLTQSDGKIISLTSLQIASAMSWLKRNGYTYSHSVLMRGNFTLDQLLNEAGNDNPPAVAPKAPKAEPATGAGIGIDIEHVDSMPVCDDFWTDDFYRSNFTDREIAHCISSTDDRLSFTGLWAAKEAALKAGIGDPQAMAVKHIEIVHDDQGRPSCLYGNVSISHIPGIAVAVFHRFPSARPEPAMPASTVTPLPTSSKQKRLVASIAGVVVILSAVELAIWMGVF